MGSKSAVHGLNLGQKGKGGNMSDPFAKGPLDMDALLAMESKEKEVSAKATLGGASILQRANRLSQWSKSQPKEEDSDEDDTEIQRLDDEEGFVDFTKVGHRSSVAGGSSQGSGGRSLKNMLGKKFQNRVSLIKRDSIRRESLRERRMSGQVGKGDGGGAMGAIEEDESDEMEKILENAEDFESNALHHNYDMINLRLRPEIEEESPYRGACIE